MSNYSGCVCKGIRFCAICENLEKTRIRRQKFKKNPDRETVIERYDHKKPQIQGILVIENFITQEEQSIIAERMNKVWFSNNRKYNRFKRYSHKGF